MAMGTRSLTAVIRYLLLTGAVSALQAAPAFAQDPSSSDETPPPESTPKTAKLGKIEVTGTRIKRADVEAGRPINIITKEQIRASGLTSIGEILQTLPSSGSAPNAH